MGTLPYVVDLTEFVTGEAFQRVDHGEMIKRIVAGVKQLLGGGGVRKTNPERLRLQISSSEGQAGYFIVGI